MLSNEVQPQTIMKTETENKHVTECKNKINQLKGKKFNNILAPSSSFTIKE